MISIAMIVRDEETTLGRALESFAPHVDEVVVVDTGSIDGTREVARRYTDQVYDFTWIKDFAAARQYAFDRAHGDWVGHFDADDVVRGAEHIRGQAEGAGADVGALCWPYVVAWDAYGHPTCEFWRERLVRNDGSYRWHGRVHETLTSRKPYREQHNSDVIVEHRPIERQQERPWDHRPPGLPRIRGCSSTWRVSTRTAARASARWRCMRSTAGAAPGATSVTRRSCRWRRYTSDAMTTKRRSTRC
jgi:hypothetical protein